MLYYYVTAMSAVAAIKESMLVLATGRSVIDPNAAHAYLYSEAPCEASCDVAGSAFGRKSVICMRIAEDTVLEEDPNEEPGIYAAAVRSASDIVITEIVNVYPAPSWD